MLPLKSLSPPWVGTRLETGYKDSITWHQRQESWVFLKQLEKNKEIRSHLSQSGLLGSDCSRATRVFKEATGQLGSAWDSHSPPPPLPPLPWLTPLHASVLTPWFSCLFLQPYRLCKLPLIFITPRTPFLPTMHLIHISKMAQLLAYGP